MRIGYFFNIFICSVFFIGCFENIDILKQDKTVLANIQQKNSGHLLVVGSYSVLEIMEDLGYKNIIGRCDDSQPNGDYYKKLVQIGESSNPDINLIRNLKPDFYLSDIKYKNVLKSKFLNNGISVKFFDFSTYENSINSIVDIGAFINKEKNAEQIIQTIEAKILEVRREIYDKEKYIVVFLLFKDDDIFLGTGISFVGSLLEVLKVFPMTEYLKDDQNEYIEYDKDKVKELNPDIIIYLNEDNLPDNAFYENKLKEDLKSVKAIKNKDIYQLDNISFKAGGFKMMNSIEKLKRIIYKD